MRRSRSAWLPSPSSTRISNCWPTTSFPMDSAVIKPISCRKTGRSSNGWRTFSTSRGVRRRRSTPLPITLHEGFVDHDLKLCFYTDHQIFDRYQRYRINGEIKRDEQMTVAELNQLRMGDYVVHIDHGVGRFGGLVKINENGKVHEAIKLIYKDNDVLFVHVHALHRISRYKSGEGEAPKI